MEYDENLWFYHQGCEGKHYLLGNPHIVAGRIWAYCPCTNQTIFISLADIGECSLESKYWLKGYLHGSQPDPPIDPEIGVDFQSESYQIWLQSAELFLETGFWSDQLRNCKKCGKKLMASESGENCISCGK